MPQVTPGYKSYDEHGVGLPVKMDPKILFIMAIATINRTCETSVCYITIKLV